MAVKVKRRRLVKSHKCVDRISDLPVPILQHILSFLPSLDAVQTCILSKHWRQIWCYVDSLDLNYNSSFHRLGGSKFHDFVDRFLLSRHVSKIRKFALSLSRVTTWQNKVHLWIIHALKHNVEVLDIDTCVNLTPHVFTSENLREFKLSNNDLYLPSFINLPALRKLHLNGVFIGSGQLDEPFFSAIPSLETFIMQDTKFKNHKFSTISARRLKSFTLTGNFTSSIDICSPNLTLLKLEKSNSEVEFSKCIRIDSNLTNVVEASIRLPVSCFESLIQLFTVLQNSRNLTLSASFLQSFAVLLQNDSCISKYIGTPFHNLKSARLETDFSDGEILVINTLVSNSPHIEALYLENVEEEADEMIISTHCEEEKVWRVYKLSHLKLVEIKGFRASENEVKFVEFLLDNELVLKNLIITMSSSCSENKEELIQSGRRILMYPRASRVRIMLVT
ncbi:hypothetical protein ACHQM5_025044 [Ranunculus cassubicifolius]